ncbi:MAG: hypothetical protein FJ215_04595 [Ignavibacteria bacterium]|nr:hypothetical protein [Ignavibacteria bacterium]
MTAILSVFHFNRATADRVGYPGLVVALALLLAARLPAQTNPARENVLERHFSWGTVRMVEGSSSTRLRIDFETDARNQAGAGVSPQEFVSTGVATIMSMPILPSHSFYLAVPPHAKIVPKVTTLEAQGGARQAIPATVGFAATSDTSAIDAIYVDANELGMYELPPVVSVESVEWFRGLTVARISISPFTNRQSEIVSLSGIEFSLEFERREGIADPIQTVNDPHFDKVREHFIVNIGKSNDISVTPLEWSDSTGRWIDYTSQYVKLNIAVDGIYRLTAEDLAGAAPQTTEVDPRNFRLVRRGIEIPLHLSGESDGKFSGSDFIEFPAFRNYGSTDYRRIPQPHESYPSSMDRYTDTSTYWLTWESQRGLRLETNEGIAATNDTLEWYSASVHIERDDFLQFVGGDIVVHQDPRWLAGDVWGWGWLSANGTFSATFQASRVYRGGPPGKIFARFAGWAAQNVVPAHRVRLRINSSDTLQSRDASQYEHVLMQADVPAGLWNEGSNTIRVHSLPTQSSVNWILFDWAEAEYPRWLQVENDTLFFRFTNLAGSGVRVVRITGLSRTDVVIYKCGPVLRRISSFDVHGSGPYAVSFADTVSPGDAYMIASVPRLRRPVFFGARKFTNLRNPMRGADYILLTHSRFLGAAQSYTSHIQSQYKLRTTLINVEDVFDEFGYGFPTPESIREFMKATTRWQSPMPSFLFIVGDATYDFKYVMSSPNPETRPLNSVPSFGHPVSDPYLTVLDDTSILPQLFVGRIPIGSSAEVLRYLLNHQSYQNARYDDWNKKYLFFAGGDPNVAGQVESFRIANEAIIRDLVKPAPIGGLGISFYKTKNPQSDFGPYDLAEVRRVLAEGAIAINYVGHSGTQTWDNGIGEPSQLQNSRGRFALVSDFGCSTAKFAEPDVKSFGELFTLGETGSAIGYVGNSALGFTSNALALPAHFYRQFLSRGMRRLGEIHLQAKLDRLNETGGIQIPTSRIMMLTNVLIGDPVIDLAVPQDPNLSLAANGIAFVPQIPSDDDDDVELSIPYMNTGLATPDSFAVSIKRGTTAGEDVVTHKLPLPLFRDTLRVKFSVKGQPGEHQFTVRLNPDHALKELYADDNMAMHRILVSSNSFRLVKPHPFFGGATNQIVLLNPQNLSPEEIPRVECEVDTSAEFANPLRISAAFGEVSTVIGNAGLLENRLYHWRSKSENSSRPQSTGTFRTFSPGVFRWIQKDSADWAESVRINVGNRADGLSLTERTVSLRVTSSGFVDGAFGAVEFDGVNVLPNTFGRGHTVVLLDSSTLTVQQIRVFDTFGFPVMADSLAGFINSLTPGQLVIQLIIDEGANNLTAAAKNAIRTLGSAYIDSVKFRDSWAIIKKKGAARGSVPEAWRKAYTGRVIIDTAYLRKNMARDRFSHQ